MCVFISMRPNFCSNLYKRKSVWRACKQGNESSSFLKDGKICWLSERILASPRRNYYFCNYHYQLSPVLEPEASIPLTVLQCFLFSEYCPYLSQLYPPYFFFESTDIMSQHTHFYVLKREVSKKMLEIRHLILIEEKNLIPTYKQVYNTDLSLS